MGACSVAVAFPGNLTEAEVEKRYTELVRQQTVEYGTDPYNGTFATLPSLTIYTGKRFENFITADDYCLEHSEKWENAVAVKAMSDEKEWWYVAGWAAH